MANKTELSDDQLQRVNKWANENEDRDEHARFYNYVCEAIGAGLKAKKSRSGDGNVDQAIWYWVNDLCKVRDRIARTLAKAIERADAHDAQYGHLDCEAIAAAVLEGESIASVSRRLDVKRNVIEGIVDDWLSGKSWYSSDDGMEQRIRRCDAHRTWVSIARSMYADYHRAKSSESRSKKPA